jgi:hypothetical protein
MRTLVRRQKRKRVETRRFGPFSFLPYGEARSNPPVSYLTAAQRGLC